MNIAPCRLWSIALVVALSSIASHAAAQVEDAVLDALLKFKEDKELPAKEAGVLVKLTIEQGDDVQAGQVIGVIDDSEPKIQKEVAGYALAAAHKTLTDDVEIRFAKAAAAVVQADYELLRETNRINPKTITLVEMRAKKLEWDKTLLSIEKAGYDKELAKFEADTKGAELKATDLAIRRRTIVAPFSGEVVELDRKQDEWVNPGDRILRLAQCDIMNIEGRVLQNSEDRTADKTYAERLVGSQGSNNREREYDPHELQGCTVTVEVQLARERTEKVQGKIVYVSPVVQFDGKFLVRAEVPNRQENGNWVLLDGQRAKMTVHLNTGDGAAPEISRRP